MRLVGYFKAHCVLHSAGVFLELHGFVLVTVTVNVQSADHIREAVNWKNKYLSGNIPLNRLKAVEPPPQHIFSCFFLFFSTSDLSVPFGLGLVMLHF